MIHMSQEQAGKLYAVHKEKPFFGELVAFIRSAPSWSWLSKVRARWQL